LLTYIIRRLLYSTVVLVLAASSSSRSSPLGDPLAGLGLPKRVE
jgi:hypothetical protein